MKQKQLLPNLMSKSENKRYFSLIFIFFFLTISVSVNAANVTVSTAQTFGALDGSGLDDDGMANGIFTVNGDLTVSPTGTISCNDPLAPPNNSACPIRIYVTGNMVIQAGGSVYSENSIDGGSGGSIEITVDGNLTVFEGGITSSSRVTTGGSGNGGPITIAVGGNIDFMPGSIIASSDEGGGHAGDIRITAEGTINMDGLVSAGSTYDLLPLPGRLTDFVVDRGNTTQKGAKIIVISHSVCQGAGVNIGSTGVLVSQGEDPASDSISVEACGIHVFGMIASVSKKGNGSTTNRSVVLLRSGGDILINGADLGQQGTNQGRVRADYVIGEAPEAISVNMYAKDDITIIGPSSGTIYTVSSNGGSATNQPGGTINGISLNGGISLTGLSLQADGGASGSAGGVINLQAKNTIDANSSTMVARGSTANSTGSDGGDVFVRSFSGNINGNASSVIDVTGGNPSPEGSVSLTACGTIGFPPGSIIPASITPALNNNCSPAAPTLPAGVSTLPNCGSNAAITIVPTGTTTVCAGNCVTLTATGGVSYLWSPNGETTPSISACTTGDYSVVGTNAGGCTGTSNTIHITINPNPEPSISGTPSFCSGSSTQLCATAGFDSYNWSTGATTQCITVSTASTFTVTVFDANGCSGSASATTTVNQNPEPSISGTPSFCSGSSTQLCAIAGFDSYNWSTGATTQCITVSTASTFTVTVTDANGCSGSASATTSVNQNPEPSISGTPSFCSGSSTQLCAAAGFDSYNWSTGATTQCITVSTANTFTVTVSDANGCSGSASATTTVNQNQEPSISGTLSFCSGSSTQICAPAGLASYNWSTGATTQCITVSTANTFTVTVTNANGCSGSASATTTVNQNPQPSISGTLSFCSGSSTQICAPAGLASYNWSTGATTQCITVSTANTFTVTVTNANGCSGSASATTIVNPKPTPTISGSSSFCAGSSTQICAPAGLASYLWSTGATTQCITVSTANTFTVTVTNANGCSASCSKTITVNQVPSCTITGSNTICQGGSTSLCAPSGGGNVYLWSTGATTSCIAVSSAGTYTVTVTKNGCSATCSKTVSIGSVPSCTITGNSSCGSGTVQICASSGTGYTYLWNNGATTQCRNVSPGTYTVTVTNSSGCSSSCSKTVISACSGFRTQTLGGWGATPSGNNSAKYLYNNFASVFTSPNYLTIGCTNKFKFTTPQALTAFLPAGTTPAGLPSGTFTNPNSSQGSVFASQLIAATINVRFDLAFANFSSNSIHLQDLVIASGTFAGWTVSQVLTEANKKIGGCTSSYTYSQLNDVLNSINTNYDNGSSNNGFLLCPGSLREANEGVTEVNTANIQTSVYPNPFNSSSTIEFSKLDEAGHLSIELFTLAGSKIVKLFDKDVEAGVKYKVMINAERLQSGIYVYRIISGDNVINGKLILMK